MISMFEVNEESGVDVEPKAQVLLQKIEESMEELSKSTPISAQRLQERVYQFLRELLKVENGLILVYKKTPALVTAGIFKSSGWEKTDRLLPVLVRGSLLANGIFPTIESLSNLRMVSIALGEIKDEALSQEAANEYLIELLALNLDILFDHKTEESRTKGYQYKLSHQLMKFISTKIDLTNLFQKYFFEIKALSHQRPIITTHIRKTLESGKNLVAGSEAITAQDEFVEFMKYYNACFSPTALSREYDSLIDYRSKLPSLSEEQIKKEAQTFGEHLKKTGLSSPYFAVFLKYLTNANPELIPVCLNLNEHGKADFEKHQENILKLLRMCIKPSTHEYIYGLSRFLERNLLARKEVVSGIKKLVDMDIAPEVAGALLKRRKFSDSMSPNAILICGVVAVLGQPLGIGQGNNPTCQAARGISLWSQHDPGFLIDVLISAARDGLVSLNFEGQHLVSKDLLTFKKEQMEDTSVDPVSQVLVPHLDAIYAVMLGNCYGRGADAHKWANPALYGRWINHGFDSVLDVTQTCVAHFENFVRKFYATHHPLYNDENPITYANPVGIFITNTHGDLLGLHAVSIQRIAKSQDGEYRVYFFNPNNEGRQNWGQGVIPTVYKNNERFGESSLPFNMFASRLYAFHYNPYEEGDGYAAPTEEVQKVVEMAKSSWGKSYTWLS